MDIVKIINKCSTWSDVKDFGRKDARYRVSVYFDDLEDAKKFTVELMMVASGQEPYDQTPDDTLVTNGDQGSAA